MIAGGLAVAPLVIHLLSMRGYRREPWAAMQFLIAAQRSARHRLRFEQWFLLLLRTLIVLLIGLTLARPFTARSSMLDVLGETRSDRVIVIDDSFSMRALREDGVTAFEKARAMAGELIARADVRDGIALVRAGAAAAAIVDRPTRDRQVLERILADWNCSLGMNDLHSALRIASDMLTEESVTRGGRICYVLTDFTQAAFEDHPAAVADSIALPGIDKLVFLNVGSQRRGNLAITSLRTAGQIVGVGIPARFAVEVANESSHSLERVEVEVTVDGSSVISVPIGPIMSHESAIGEFELAFQRMGPHRIRAKIRAVTEGRRSAKHEDPLPADDERFLAVDVSRPISVLAVDREVAQGPRIEDLFFYTTALSPDTNQLASSRRPLFEIRRIAQPRLDDELLDSYDVIALGNLRRLTSTAASRLEEFVRSGGGVVLFLGADVSVESYNEYARRKDGFLPIQLERIAQFEQQSELPRFEIADARHPVTIDLAGNDAGGLQRSFVQACWKLRPFEGPAESSPRTILQLTTGEPVLVSCTVGRGRILYWLVAADMSWTNLPGKPDYVPLMMNLTVYAAGDHQSELNLLCGQPLVLRYPGRFARHLAVISTPEGSTLRAELESESTGCTLNYRETLHPGFYSVAVADQPRLFAVNPDTTDHDLTEATRETIRQRFGSRAELVDSLREVTAKSTAGVPREFAQLLMFALLTAVVAETLAGACFGTRR